MSAMMDDFPAFARQTCRLQETGGLRHHSARSIKALGPKDPTAFGDRSRSTWQCSEGLQGERQRECEIGHKSAKGWSCDITHRGCALLPFSHDNRRRRS